MKNTIFIAALIVALIAVFAAPAHSDGLILRGGMNFANAETDPNIDGDNRKGANAALLAEIGGGGLRLLTGAGYENRGMHGDNADVRLDYVTIPVMLSIGTPTDGGLPRFFINAGIEPAFLVASDLAFDNITFDVDAEEFDFGLRGEAGLEIPLNTSAGLVIGAGYSQSITDAAKDDDLEWFNHAFHIFGGVKIGM